MDFIPLDSLCLTPLFVPIKSNSTIWSVISPCLSLVGAPAIPAAFAPLCTALLIAQVRIVLQPPLQWSSKLVVAKMTLAALDLVASALHLIALYYFTPHVEVTREQHVGAILSLLFSVCAIVAYWYCVRGGVVSSGLLHIAWASRLVSLLPAGVLVVHNALESASSLLFVQSLSFLSHFVMALVINILLCRADRHSGEGYVRLTGASGKKVFPDSTSSAISSLVYWYASPMIWLGLRQRVDYDQLWELDAANKAETLRHRFLGTRTGVGRLNLSGLFWRLVCSTWEMMLIPAVLVLFITAFRYSNSLFLRAIVDSVSSNLPLWYSLLLIVGLFFVDLFQAFGALSISQKLMCTRRDVMSFTAYLNIRSILTVSIFDKMLKLSAGAKSRYSAGEVLNLITTDLARVRLFWFQFRDFIYCPFMLMAGLFGLWSVIGWNTCYGVAVLIVLLPVNFVISKRMSHYEQLQMKYKDARLKLTNDIFSGIRVLKLYAWEPPMQEMVAKLRRLELETLRKIFILDAMITSSFQFGPVMAAVLSFLGYTVIQGNRMTPDVAFVSMMFFVMLRYAIYQLPQILANSIKAYVSGGRIVKFLNEDEQQPSHLDRNYRALTMIDGRPEEAIVEIANCCFSWTGSSIEASDGASTNGAQLKDISLSVQRGELIGVVGRVASGKSSLLSALVGEMQRAENGSACTVKARTLGYVPQQAWIQNRALRDNVLFDSPMDEAHYSSTLEACALKEDLALLPAGDNTEIGEKGINLSGGQKARVSLARAVYQRAELYILDDTLSAVDSHVGAHIFERVIGKQGLLADATRIFALNTLSFLKGCDRIVVMKDGRIEEVGTWSELKQRTEGAFAELMREYVQKQVERQKSRRYDEVEPAGSVDDLELDGVLNDLAGSPLSESVHDVMRSLSGGPISPTRAIVDAPTTSNGDAHAMMDGRASFSPTHRQLSRNSSSFYATDFNTPSTAAPPMSAVGVVGQSGISAGAESILGRLIEEEELAEGMVSRQVYIEYGKAFGLWLVLCYVTTLFFGSALFASLSNVWLAKWSSEAQLPTNASSHDTVWNLSIYGAFGMANSISAAVSGMFLAVGAYHASRKFHDDLLYSLLRSPIAFFDRTPLGRIINRLSGDIDRIDEDVPFSASYTLILLAESLNSLISIVIVIPLMVLVIVPLLIIFLVIGHFYTRSCVQFRRLTSKSWSTMCSFIQDSYTGSDSIRAYDVVERFHEKACRIVDFATESVFVEVITNRWIQVRLDLLTDAAVFVFILIAILLADEGLLSLGALALVISSGCTFSGFLGEIARMWREVETHVVCIERVREYINNMHEAKWESSTPPHNWPSMGEIRFHDFSLRYKPDSEVLKSLNFTVKGGTKVGIVGRTGAGKTSMTLSLFRIVEPASGTIYVDGVDVKSIGLHELRKALTIIPQDPVLFCGSLRSNLDPFDEYSDAELWNAIGKAHLTEFVAAFENKLLFDVAESGTNLSVGQRQLVCLARALLRQSTRVLILDEATAAIDVETDRLIQHSIRENFSQCTILTIAHRLNTVLDYDSILVMDEGRVAEYDSPQALLSNPESLFSNLAKHAGISSIHKS